jgi:NitT/TauT family transport system substrate-binding protein
MKAIDFLLQNPTQAQQDVSDAIAQITSKRLAAGVVAGAWQNLTFTMDPLAPSLKASADHAYQLGLLKDKNLAGIYDIRLLNELLAATGKPAVSVA